HPVTTGVVAGLVPATPSSQARSKNNRAKCSRLMYAVTAYSSAVNPDACTIGPHRSKSDFITFANSLGEVPAGSKESLASPALNASDLTAWRIAKLRLLTMSAGVLAGTRTPNHPAASS